MVVMTQTVLKKPSLAVGALEKVLTEHDLEFGCLLYNDIAGKGHRICHVEDTMPATISGLCTRLVTENRHPILSSDMPCLHPVNMLQTDPYQWPDPDAQTLHTLTLKEGYSTAYYLPFRDAQGDSFFVFTFNRSRPVKSDEIAVVFTECYRRLTRLETELSSAEALAGVLSQRERECLSHAAQGKTEKRTAQDLAISPHTVHSHIESAKRKLGAKNKLAALLKAIKTGEIDPNHIDIS